MENAQNDLVAIFGEPIYSYTRAMALEDGALVDAGDMAQEAGFKWPVALTQAAWAECVTVPAGVTGQDERGRLWDVLSTLLVTIKLKPPAGNTLQFEVRVKTARGRRIIILKSIVGPDDTGAPCFTIMLPHED